MKIDDFVGKVGICVVAFALWIKPVTQVTASYSAAELPPIEVVKQEPTINEAQLEAEAKDKHCLAVMVYGEARGENFYGKAAVAWVAMNRYQNLPYNTMCQVVLDTDQFQAFDNKNFVVDATTGRAPSRANEKDEASWQESQKVAELTYDEIIPDPTYGAQYFINPKKMKRKAIWLRKFRQKVVIENHHFYG